MSEQKTRAFAPDVEIPLLGFGTYLIPDAETADAVEAALAAGYRHVDTAETYQNERGVGDGLRRGMASNGLTRTDVFVKTKLWPGAAGRSFKSVGKVVQSLDESLDKLGLDYVDLYLIHAPFNREQRLAQWGALVELQESKKARAIGVSNFNAGQIEELVAVGLPLPHANQIEMHPWSQKPELVSYLDSEGITPLAYSSLVPLSTSRTAAGHGSGRLTPCAPMVSAATRHSRPWRRSTASPRHKCSCGGVCRAAARCCRRTRTPFACARTPTCSRFALTTPT